MGQVSLRELVQKYTKGEVGKEEYRKTRTDLINNVLAREDNLRINTYPPLIKPTDEGTVDITERSQKKEPVKSPATPGVTPPADKTVPSRGQPLNPMYIAGALILIIITIIAVVVLLPDHSQNQRVNVQEQPVTQETRPAPAVSDRARTLIREFLQKNNWDNGNMDEFLRAWRALPETDSQSIKGSMALNRLSNAIYNRLQEERAIAELDATASETVADVSRQERLVAFARQIGINDDRISVQAPAVQDSDQTIDEKVSSPVVDESSPTAAESETAAIPPAAQPQTASVDLIETGKSDNPAQVAVVTPAATEIPAEEPVTTTQAPRAATQVSPEPVQVKPVPAAAPATQTKKTQSAITPATVTSQKSGNCDPTLLNSRRPYCRDIIPGIGNGPTMVIIPAGKFAMGGDHSEEQPVHNVVIAKPFAMSVHEITYGEYQLFCKETNRTCPTQPWAGNDYPVVNVSWNDATVYTEWLSAETGQRYRLPSESQWEYAARGGTKTIYPFGDTIDISYAVFSERKTLSSPLPKTDRTINRNKFRLYHIVGNVREWVADTWVGNYNGAPGDGSPRLDGDKSMRIARGGSYLDNAEALRSAARKSLPANTTDSYTGFRVIQDLF